MSLRYGATATNLATATQCHLHAECWQHAHAQLQHWAREHDPAEIMLLLTLQLQLSAPTKLAVACTCSMTQLHVPLRPTFLFCSAVTSVHAVRQ